MIRPSEFYNNKYTYYLPEVILELSNVYLLCLHHCVVLMLYSRRIYWRSNCLFKINVLCEFLLAFLESLSGFKYLGCENFKPDILVCKKMLPISEQYLQSLRVPIYNI